MVTAPKLRIARPTDALDMLLRFYEAGLGLAMLGRFDNHDGFDGVMLGAEDAPYHFEFTRAHGHRAGRAPTPENLLVFCYPQAAEWRRAADRMRAAGFDPVPSFNPHWDREGLTFEDPDGYRVVLQQGDWPR